MGASCAFRLKLHKRDDLDAWVVPYEHDTKLRCMWRNAFKYEELLLEHPGIVSWDFSMYRRMPFGLQFWNCYMGRLLGSLHERLGGECIPNIRPTDSRSFAYAFDGRPADAEVHWFEAPGQPKVKFKVKRWL